MPSIIIQNMEGLIPRASPRLLGNSEATVALMVRLWAGEAQPFYKLLQNQLVTLPGPDPIRTIYLLLDKWLAWTKDVDVVTGFDELTGPGHIYYTGDDYPKQAVYSDIYLGPPTPVVFYPIGIGPPVTPPTVTIAGTGAGTPEIRSYVYTQYTLMNEESVPSPPSTLISVLPGQSVIVSNFPASPEPNVVEYRVYRTAGSGYFFVGSISVPGPATLTDSVPSDELGEPLQSQHYYPPPSNLAGLIGLACGSLAGFVGNKVYFSEPYQPGGWPPEYVKIFDYPVVALGTFGQTCVVATTGYTYMVSGNDPRSFSVARIPDPYPCVSKRSMVSADRGVVYASNDGLMFVGGASYSTGYSGTHVLTREIMTWREWQKYVPNSITGVIFDGRYFGFYQTGTVDINKPPGAGFIFDFSDRVVQGVEGDSQFDKNNTLIDLSFFASAAFSNPQVPLHVVVNTMIEEDVLDPNPELTPVPNALLQWEGSGALHPMRWRSKQFSFPYVVTFGAAKILFREENAVESLVFRVLDGATGALLFQRPVSTRDPFRFPSLRPRTDWMFEVEGTRSVQMIHVATSYVDLSEGKAP